MHKGAKGQGKGKGTPRSVRQLDAYTADVSETFYEEYDKYDEYKYPEEEPADTPMDISGEAPKAQERV